MIWDNSTDFWGQDPDTQDAIWNATAIPPIDQATEPAGDGTFERILWQVYLVDETLSVKLTYIYANPANANAWAALADFTIEKV